VSVCFTTDDARNWWFTGVYVYGPQQDAEKVAFLEELREVRFLCTGPWLLVGDFNMIYSS
jgi:hypothetical protein